MTKSKSQSRQYLILFLAFFVLAVFLVVMYYMPPGVVETAFKLLNFGIFCGLVAWYLKTKHIPETREKIAQKHELLQSKADQNKILLNRHREFDNEIKKQELLAQKLFDQIKMWSSSFELKQKELQQEQTELMKKAVQRAQAQAEQKMETAVEQMVAAKVLENIKHTLTDQFASEQEGKKFNAVIFDFMRKEVS